MKTKKNYLILALLLIFNIDCKTQDIQIHYLGHAAFVLQFDDLKIVSDYGKPNAWKEWGWDSQIRDIGDLVPDVMTYSHLHEDHYDSTRIPTGVKYILRNGEDLNFKELDITSIPTCEDKFGEFNNTSYLFSHEGLNVVHTGDIQTMIANINKDSIASYLKNNYPKSIDVLIMPIEGKIKYIPQTERFIQALKPNVVIPCHHWSQEYINEFIHYLEMKEYAIKKGESSSYVFKASDTKYPQIVILRRSNYIDKDL